MKNALQADRCHGPTNTATSTVVHRATSTARVAFDLASDRNARNSAEAVKLFDAARRSAVLVMAR